MIVLNLYDSLGTFTTLFGMMFVAAKSIMPMPSDDGGHISTLYQMEFRTESTNTCMERRFMPSYTIVLLTYADLSDATLLSYDGIGPIVNFPNKCAALLIVNWPFEELLLLLYAKRGNNDYFINFGTR